MAQAQSAARFEVALQHHERGRLDDAERLYREALALQPTNVQALHCAGVLALQVGDCTLAVRRLRRAIELGSRIAGSYLLLGRAYKGIDDVDAAIGSYRRAITLDPSLTDAHVCLGIALQKQNRLTAAEAAFNEALRQQPDAFEARLNLANTLQLQNKFAEALQHYEQLSTAKDDSADLHYNAGKALRALDRNDEAIERFQRAVTLDSGFLEAYYNLANAISDAKGYADAIDCYRLVLELLDSGSGRPKDAVARDTLRRDAKGGLAAALIWSFRYEEAVALLREVLDWSPDSVPLHEHLLVALPYRFMSRVEVRRAYEHYQRIMPLRDLPRIGPRSDDRKESRKLRIAYSSGDFRDHSVAFFLEPILAHHDKQRFEVVCYSSNKQDDAVTDRLRGYADQWIDATPLSDSELARRIADDGVDILVDVSGRTLGNRLGAFAHHPATLQVGYLGYPTFSGLHQIEFRITDTAIDPPAFDTETALAAEHPLRLPNSMFCYRPSADAPGIVERIRDTSRPICFGSFNQVPKISPATLEAWIGILRCVPHSRLLLKSFGFGDEATRQRILGVFLAAKIASDRISIRGGEAERRDHLALYREVDIVLDTFPYNGATTTCEALWMGVPVITLAGETHASRVGASLLGALGLDEFITTSAAEYIDRSVALANDPIRLRELQLDLRPRFAASPLRDEVGFTRDFERIVYTAWKAQVASKVTLASTESDLGLN